MTMFSTWFTISPTLRTRSHSAWPFGLVPRAAPWSRQTSKVHSLADSHAGCLRHFNFVSFLCMSLVTGFAHKFRACTFHSHMSWCSEGSSFCSQCYFVDPPHMTQICRMGIDPRCFLFRPSIILRAVDPGGTWARCSVAVAT